MGFLKDIKLKPSNAGELTPQADEKKNAFSNKTPAAPTRQVDATGLGQKLVKDAQRSGDPDAIGEAIIAAPGNANILAIMDPPSVETPIPNVPIADLSSPAEREVLVRDVELLRKGAPQVSPEAPSSGPIPSEIIELTDSTQSPVPIPQGALPPKGEYALNELLTMDKADLLRLALVECACRGISFEDELLDDKSMRNFVKALNHHGLSYDDIFKAQEVLPPVGAEHESKPKTRIDSPNGRNKPIIIEAQPVSIRPLGNDDANPFAGTLLQPSDQLLQPGPMVSGQKPKKTGPPPLPKADPKAAEAQPLDVLGIHAAIELVENDPKLNASQKVEAASRHFQENKGIQDFMAKYGEGFLPLLERAVDKLRSGQAPDGDERIALDLNELFNYIKKKEEQAGVYSGVRKDIDAQQGQKAPSLPVPFSIVTGPKQAAPAPPSSVVPIQKQGSAFTRFIVSPTTLSALGAAAFGGVLYHFGGFEELTLGFNRLFKTGAARDAIMLAYASATSLSILVTELFRRFKVNRKAATYENVEKLPAELKAMYRQVVDKLTQIARAHAKREDQTMALINELKDEGFFNSIDELLSRSRGEPLVAAIDASGLNPKVPVLEAIRMAERKIMKEKLETLACYLTDKEPRLARFKSMYVQDAVFKNECDKLLAADGWGRLLNYPTLVAICSLVKGNSGEKITEPLIAALRQDYTEVDSRFAK